MKKLIAATILSISATTSVSVSAVDCWGHVKHIQIQSNSILVLLTEQNAWKNAGDIGDPATEHFLQALLAAQLAGKKVMLRYPNNCTQTDYGTKPIAVRTSP